MRSALLLVLLAAAPSGATWGQDPDLRDAVAQAAPARVGAPPPAVTAPFLPPLPLPDPELPADALPLPIMRQATPYSCGVAALLSVLYYWKAYDGNEQSLYKRLGTTPKDGTSPEKLAEGARALGLLAELREGVGLGELRQALRRGDTVVLDVQAWRAESSRGKAWKDLWEDGHYVVLAGLDAHYLYAMDPAAGPGYAWLPIPEFLERWHDYSDRGGRRREYRNAAVFIRGRSHLKTVPGPLIRLE